MGRLILEKYVSQEDKWIQIGELGPNDSPGSISDNKPDGTRDIYIFVCYPDSRAGIYRSKVGIDAVIDTEDKRIRAIFAGGEPETIKEFKSGDEPYVMEVKTDKSLESRRIRFTYR